MAELNNFTLVSYADTKCVNEKYFIAGNISLI